jgi:glycosyltransferase involved in cell wall biosynthesis
VKILLTSGIFPPDIGGPATYLPQLSSDLEALGHEVTVVTLGKEDEVKQFERIKVIKISRNSSLIKRMVLTSLQILKECLKSDAVFSNGLFIETALALTLTGKKRCSVVKVVGDPVWERARNSGTTSLPLNDFLSKKLNFRDAIMRKIYMGAWSAFRFRTAPSLELCAFISSQIRSSEAIYIPNGVDVLPDSKDEREIDIICVSRLVNWKNVDLVIRVAGELNLSLLVIGDGPERDSLEALATQLNVQAEFKGQLAVDEVSAWLNRSKYFLLLSDYEGLSFALLEAMASGVVPVVSSNKGNLSVIQSGKNGIITEIKLDAVISAIKSLEQNPNIAKEIASAARNHVYNNFDGHKQRGKIIDLILGKNEH